MFLTILIFESVSVKSININVIIDVCCCRRCVWLWYFSIDLPRNLKNSL